MRSTAVLPAFWPLVPAVAAHWHWHERRKVHRGLWSASLVGLGLQLAVLGLVPWQAAASLAKAALIGWVTHYPPGPGEPPFSRQGDGTPCARPMTAEYRLALHRFPDPAACLQPGADATTSDGLARMDWDRITRREEAEVCLFRLAALLPDGMAGFTAFAEAKGFTLSDDDLNPDNPDVELDGTLRVTGFWSLRQNGPKFPTDGLGQILASVPYGMDVDATFTPDARCLPHVGISFLTF